MNDSAFFIMVSGFTLGIVFLRVSGLYFRWLWDARQQMLHSYAGLLIIVLTVLLFRTGYEQVFYGLARYLKPLGLDLRNQSPFTEIITSFRFLAYLMLMLAVIARFRAFELPWKNVGKKLLWLKLEILVIFSFLYFTL